MILDQFFLIITRSMDAIFLVPLSVIILVFLICKKRKKDAVLFSTTMLSGFILEQILKRLLQKSRPENPLINASGFSFPSGHATMAVIFFSLLIYLYKDKIKNKLLRYSFISACIILTALIGYSRIYLNVHYLTDVLGGFLIGFVWVFLIITLFKKK